MVRVLVCCVTILFLDSETFGQTVIRERILIWSDSSTHRGSIALADSAGGLTMSCDGYIVGGGPDYYLGQMDGAVIVTCAAFEPMTHYFTGWGGYFDYHSSTVYPAGSFVGTYHMRISTGESRGPVEIEEIPQSCPGQYHTFFQPPESEGAGFVSVGVESACPLSGPSKPLTDCQCQPCNVSVTVKWTRKTMGRHVFQRTEILNMGELPLWSEGNKRWAARQTFLAIGKYVRKLMVSGALA